MLIILVMQAKAKMRNEEFMVVGKLKAKQEVKDFFLNKRKDLPPLLRSKHLLVDFTIRMNNHKLQQLGEQFASAFDPNSKTLQKESVEVSEDKRGGQDEKECRLQLKKGDSLLKTGGLWMKDYLPCKKRRYTENTHKEHYNFIEREKGRSRSKMQAVIVLKQDESMSKLLKRISLRKSVDSTSLRRANTQAIEPHEFKGFSVSLSRSESERVQPHRSIGLAKERGKKLLKQGGLNDCLMMPKSQLSRLNLSIVNNLHEVSPWKQQLNEIESYCLTPAKDWDF